MNDKQIPRWKAWTIIALCFALPVILTAAATQINLTTQVAGILPLGNGGTGQSNATVSAHNWFGNNTGSTAAPNYEQPACSDLSNSSGGCSKM